jgi:hypothetical protein
MRWSLPFVGAAAVLILLIAPIGLGHTALGRTVENAFHAPMCALVAIGLLFWLRHVAALASIRAQYLCALLLSIALGAVGELAQALTDVRHAQWIDFGNDILGALAGLGAFSLLDKHRAVGAGVRWATLSVVIVAVTIVLIPVAHIGFMYWQRWQQLPELITWRSQAGFHFITSTSADVRVVKLPLAFDAGEGQALLVSPLHESRWVGVAIEEAWPNWAGYSRLVIEVVNPNDHAVNLFLRVNDRAHNNQFDDRFNRAFVVAPRESAVFQVPLSDVQLGPKYRQIDLHAIAQVILFQDAELGAHAYYLRSMRLEE